MPSGIFKHKPHLEETKRKISEALKGRVLSKEHKNNLSKNKIGKKRKPFSEKHKLKISQSMRCDKNPNWNGGSSYIGYPPEWNNKLRKSIKERDNYTCQICNKILKKGLCNVHHIDYNKKNCNPNNLISLCDSCHTKTNYKRDYWTNFFTKNTV